MKATIRATDSRARRPERRSRATDPASQPREWLGSDEPRHTRATREQEPQTKSSGQPPSLRKWILVADDERALRMLLVRVLTQAGYTVVAARHGVEALELARQVFPHLIILDLRMPRMSGLEVLAHVRHIPVIVLSGYLRDLPPDLASRPNIVAMLEKPVTLDVLRSTVRAALSHGDFTGETEVQRAPRPGSPSGRPPDHSVPSKAKE
jgi:CheY-like chemotaxis protein